MPMFLLPLSKDDKRLLEMTNSILAKLYQMVEDLPDNAPLDKQRYVNDYRFADEQSDRDAMLGVVIENVPPCVLDDFRKRQVIIDAPYFGVFCKAFDCATAVVSTCKIMPIGTKRDLQKYLHDNDLTEIFFTKYRDLIKDARSYDDDCHPSWDD